MSRLSRGRPCNGLPTRSGSPEAERIAGLPIRERKGCGRRPRPVASMHSRRRSPTRCFELRLCRRESSERAASNFITHPPPEQPPKESAETVGSAAVHGDEPEAFATRWIRHQHTQFQSRPNIVRRVQHLRRDHGVFGPLLNDQMIDPDRRFETEFGFLPIEKVSGVLQCRAGSRAGSASHQAGMSQALACDRSSSGIRPRRTTGAPDRDRPPVRRCRRSRIR
jgi:hypothetical protein